MSRYFIGIMAIIFAIAGAAFKAPVKKAEKNKFALVTFHYNAPATNPYSYNNVTNRSLWSQGTATCASGSDKACTLQVNSDQVNGSGGLATSVVIDAVQGTEAGNYRVSGGANISSFVNKD